MPFTDDVRTTVDQYATSDLPSRQWHTDYFDFVQDAALRDRLGEEFFAARYLYKIFEGLAASGELQAAQVRLQVLQFASIYEAVLHHLLFDRFSAESPIRALTEYKVLKQYDVPLAMSQQLTSLVHDGRSMVPAYWAGGRTDATKVRFDSKAKAAEEIGLIDGLLRADLVTVYEARNSIHLHAEIRKQIHWGLEISKLAYRRLVPFRGQVVAELFRRGV